ncbi:MAG: hypothetical protein NT062_32355 [Proteobacteria bacterium]|nr:hypothetical protein [Pseudomonadota bacterium]
MAKYTVKMAPPKGHELPPLLRDVGAWIAKQEHGALGWFDGMIAEKIPKEWSPEHATLLQKRGFVFLTLGEGSMLALLDTGVKAAPPAVVLLDSEGDRRTVATSLEEFLSLWSRGETDVDDLDDEEAGAKGRKALGVWLKANKVKAPKAKAFDLQAWLDTAGGAAAAAAPVSKVVQPKRAPTDVMKKLGPKARALASIMGMRVDAPEVITYVTKTLGKKLPASTSERSDDAYVVAPKAGVEMIVTHDILDEAYPPIHKTAKSFIPYVSNAWLREELGEAVLGVPWDATSEPSITKVLGPPTGWRADFDEKKPTIPYWARVLDTGAGVELELQLRKRGLEVTISVASARDLEKDVDVTTGLFVGWAATHGLLDASRFGAHADLLAAVRKKKAKGSELVKAAMPRGLWDTHLVAGSRKTADDDLRSFAYGWFHNVDKIWITADLKKVFGKRPGPHGHDQPKLDDDTWEAVDKASKIFGERFKRWVK